MRSCVGTYAMAYGIQQNTAKAFLFPALLSVPRSHVVAVAACTAHGLSQAQAHLWMQQQLHVSVYVPSITDDAIWTGR